MPRVPVVRTAWLAAMLTALALRAGALGQTLPLSDRAVANPADWYLVTGEPGLYPGGLNVPSGAHLAYGQSQAAQIVPRRSVTVPAAAPAVGMVAVGMSNTNQEWARFAWRQHAEAGAHSRVVLVDAGLGGYDAPDMDDPADPYWLWFDQRVAAAGLGLDQIQVVWLKQSLMGNGGAWPTGAQTLQQDLSEIVGVLTARCPNLRTVYLSSRIWGAGEPWNFETAFSVKGLIATQVAALQEGGLSGPWLAWGPYLWADGLNPRSDGLVWDPNLHLEADMTHPSAAGEDQVADLLEAFYAGDALSSSWFLPAPGAPTLSRFATGDAHVSSLLPGTNFGDAQTLEWSANSRIYLKFDLRGLPEPGVERARLVLRVAAEAAIGPGQLYLASSSTWDETAITFVSAPALGASIRSLPGTSRGGIAELDVTAQVQDALEVGASEVSFVLVPPPTAVGTADYVSREGGESPLLVISGPAIFADGFESGNTASWSATG